MPDTQYTLSLGVDTGLSLSDVQQLEGALTRLGRSADEVYTRSGRAAESQDRFTTSTRKSGDEMGRAGRETDRFTTQTRKAEQQVGTMTRRLLGYAAAYLSVAKASQLIGGASRDFGEIEAALVAVGKTTDILGDELDELYDDILGLATDSVPVATSTLLELAEAAGQVGVRGSENLLRYVETFARLEASSDLQGEEAVKTLTRLMNVQGEGPENVDRMASVLVRLGANAAASESEIARHTSEVGRSTAQFKIGSTEALAYGSALAQIGTRAEGGGTAIGRTMRIIQLAVSEGGEELTGFATVANRTAEEFAAAWAASPVEALNLFLQGLAEFGADAGGALEAVGLKGDELAKVLPVLAENFRILEEAQALARDEAIQQTAMMEESERAFATQESSLQRLANVWKAASSEVGEGMSPALRQATDDAIAWLNANQDVAQDLGQSLGSALKSTVSLLKLLAENTDLIKAAFAGFIALKIPAYFVGITTAVKGLTAAMAANPIGAVLAALAVGVSLADSAIDKWAKDSVADISRITEASKAARDDIQKTVDALNSQNKAAVEAQAGVIKAQLVAERTMLDEIRSDLQEAEKELDDLIQRARRGGDTQFEARIPSGGTDETRRLTKEMEEQEHQVARLESELAKLELVASRLPDVLKETAEEAETTGRDLGGLGEESEAAATALDRLKSQVEGLQQQVQAMENFGLSAEDAALAVATLAEFEGELTPELRDWVLEQIEALRELEAQIDRLDQYGNLIGPNRGAGTGTGTTVFGSQDDFFDAVGATDQAKAYKKAQDEATAAQKEAEKAQREAAERTREMIGSIYELGDAFSFVDEDLGELVFTLADIAASFVRVQEAGGGLSGAAAGAQFGSSLGSLFGSQDNYGAEGATYGGFIGGLFGLGDWGALIGGVLGSFINKGVEEAAAQLTVQAGQVDSSVVWGDLSDSMQLLADAVAEGMERLAAETMSDLVEGFRLDLEIEAVDENRFEVDFDIGATTLPDGTQVFEKAARIFDDYADAVAFAMAEAVRQGAFEGLSPEAEALLGQWAIDTQEEFDEALALALRLERRRIGDEAFEIRRGFDSILRDFTAGLDAGIDPGSLMQGVVNGILDMRDAITGTERDQQEAAEQRAAIFNAELEILRARIELQLIELDNERRLQDLREQGLGGTGGGVGDLFQQDPGGGFSFNPLFPLEGSEGANPLTGNTPIGNGFGEGFLDHIRGIVNNWLGELGELFTGAGEDADASIETAGVSIASAGSSVAAGVNSAANDIITSAANIEAATQAVAQASTSPVDRLSESLRNLLDLLPDPISPDEIRRRSRGGGGGQDQRRETREDFRDEMRLLEAQLAGVADETLRYRASLDDLEDRIETYREAGVAEQNLARFRQMQIDLIERDFLDQFRRIVDLAAEDPFGQLIDRYQDAVDLAAEMSIEDGSVIGEAFGVEMLDAFRSQLADLEAAGDEAGIRALLADFFEMEIPPELADFFETVFPDAAAAAEDAMRRIREAAVDELGLPLEQLRDRLSSFADSVRRFRGESDSTGAAVGELAGIMEKLDDAAKDPGSSLNAVVEALRRVQIEAELTAFATADILQQTLRVAEASGDNETAALAREQLAQASYQLEIARLQLMLTEYTALGLLSLETIALVEGAIDYARENVPDFTAPATGPSGAVFSSGGYSSWQEEFIDLRDRIQAGIDAWLNLDVGPATARARQLLDEMKEMEAWLDELAAIGGEGRVGPIREEAAAAWQVAVGAFVDEILKTFEDSGLSELEQDYADLQARLADIAQAFQELGLGAEDMARLAAAQQQAMEAFWAEATSGIQGIIDRLTGVESGRAPEDLLAEQQALVDDLVLRAMTGDLAALEQLEGQADSLLDLIDEVYGGGRAGGILRDQLLAALEDIVGLDFGSVATGEQAAVETLALAATDIIERPLRPDEILPAIFGVSSTATGGVAEQSFTSTFTGSGQSIVLGGGTTINVDQELVVKAVQEMSSKLSAEIQAQSQQEREMERERERREAQILAEKARRADELLRATRDLRTKPSAEVAR